MAQANYRQIEKLLATRTPFNGNSSHAYLDSDNVYRVFSYSTLVAVYGDAETCQEMFDKGWFTTPNPIWVSDVKYSSTTSRLQNLIRKAWAI